jgi:uncharacterized membrane protein YfhO
MLYENKYYLPLGFMVNEEMLNFTLDSNLFNMQNNIFNAASGLDGDLFTLVPISGDASAGLDITLKDNGNYSYTLKENANNGFLIWEYEMPEDGLLYVYLDNIAKISITSSGGYASDDILSFQPYVFPAGVFAQGETVSFEALMLDLYLEEGVYAPSKTGTAALHAAVMDMEMFKSGYEALADETMVLTVFKDTYIKGEITADADGLLYTSIPFGKHWTAYVDGVKADILPIYGAMSTVRLNKGEHTVEFRYFNKDFAAGLCISGAALIIFVFLCVKRR